MAKNTLKFPFFQDRQNRSRDLVSISDIKVTEPITLVEEEYPRNTTLASLLTDVTETLSADIASAETGAARPYKVYSVLMTQSGTSAPTATVLENTLGGTPTLAYSSTGTFTVTLTGAFTANKTPAIQQVVTVNTAVAPNYLYGVRSSANVYTLTTGSGSALANGILSSTPIEIRVYN